MSPIIPLPTSDTAIQDMWQAMRIEALQASIDEPLMASFFHSNILNHESFASAMSFYLSNHLGSDALPAMLMRDICLQAMHDDPSIEYSMCQDLLAHYYRDPACEYHITPFLYFKGYHAVQSYRIAHYLWENNRRLLAAVIHSRMAELFDVDIHPAARIGHGLMMDHATGVVVGETTIIENNVSMLHAVTLGGSGSLGGQRHPTIREGVLLSAGAKILGDVIIGVGAKIGAGSLVLQSIPDYSTVVGVPARVILQPQSLKGASMPSLDMNHQWIDEDLSNNDLSNDNKPLKSDGLINE